MDIVPYEPGLLSEVTAVYSRVIEGVPHCWDHWRAFVFYSNLGFRVADWTYGWRRAL